MPTKRKIFHLHVKQSDEHKYYGSLQAVFNDKTNNLGVSKFTLDRHKFDVPYTNDLIVLRKGILVTSSDGDTKK